MNILVLNAGTSTLKFALFDDHLAEQTRGVIEGEAGQPAAVTGTVRRLLANQLRDEPIGSVGHRVVHGGTRFTGTVRLDATVKAELTRLSELAPLHNPPALAGIEAVEAARPGVPQVAVFDTAFFTQLPPSRYVYPLPYAWFEQWGVRRFGFHGISHAYCAGRAAEMLGGKTGLRLVICHLGNGCSATAVRDGMAIATTMGFTPLEGLMMGTRAGSVDPGILLHLQRRHGLSVEELNDALLHRSGLLGVSGVSADFRQVQAAAEAGHERARLALAMYADRVRSAIGALAVTLGGVDALVFTAGVGENSSSLRATVCDGLKCLGLRLDPKRNAGCPPDADIAATESAARILIIRTREELLIAQEASRVGLQKVIRSRLAGRRSGQHNQPRKEIPT